MLHPERLEGQGKGKEQEGLPHRQEEAAQQEDQGDAQVQQGLLHEVVKVVSVLGGLQGNQDKVSVAVACYLLVPVVRLSQVS